MCAIWARPHKKTSHPEDTIRSVSLHQHTRSSCGPHQLPDWVKWLRPLEVTFILSVQFWVSTAPPPPSSFCYQKTPGRWRNSEVGTLLALTGMEITAQGSPCCSRERRIMYLGENKATGGILFIYSLFYLQNLYSRRLTHGDSTSFTDN